MKPTPADIEASRPMQKDSIFQIMSRTKAVTALGIMMLAEEGILALRGPVEPYLPKFHDQHVAANVQRAVAARRRLLAGPVCMVGEGVTSRKSLARARGPADCDMKSHLCAEPPQGHRGDVGE